MNRCMFYLIVAAAILVSVAIPRTRAALVIDTVTVGNPGNSADSTGHGAVGYEYRIGTYEVTNVQYVEFLNAVAATDQFSLYDANMGSDPRGGITQSGSSGSFVYAAKPNMGNKPVNYVSWYDAIRFANWLHNGQGSGDTETGAYTLLGGTPTPSNGLTISRNSGAAWFLPNENEWYKAAYHKNDGATGNYFLYPTSSNSEPESLQATSVGDLDWLPNGANYERRADWNGQDGNVTTVGSATAFSDSPYGTFDQGGNVQEWNERVADGGQSRGTRGGAFLSPADDLRAMVLSTVLLAHVGNSHTGFRVANITAIPEASQVLALGAVALVAFGLRKLLSEKANRGVTTLAVGISFFAALTGSHVFADLVHHFPFNSDAADVVSGVNGTLLNGASVSGGVLVLDGMDDYVHIGQHIVPTSGSYSVSLFARRTQIDGTYVEFISQGVSLGPGFYIGITPSHEIRVSDTWMSTGVPYPLDGLWHHIALTVDAGAGNSKLYLDGSLSATLGSAIAAGSGGNATRFGRQYDPFDEFFAGMLDDIRIYDHALSAADVAVLAAIPEVSSFALLGLAAVGAGSIRLLRNTLSARFGSNRG